jgi:hypothetical protein
VGWLREEGHFRDADAVELGEKTAFVLSEEREKREGWCLPTCELEGA